MLSFELPIIPVAKERARTRISRNRIWSFTPARTKEFQNQIHYHIRKYMPEVLLASPLKVLMEFHVPRPKKPKSHYKKYPAMRPDIDNYLKALFDSFK